MTQMTRTCCFLFATVLSSALWAQPAAPTLRDLDTHCPFTPPASLPAWEMRADRLKQQLKVSLGLYPAVELDPVVPQIYDAVDYDGYTIEKVTFESLPGLMVTGNLYRPVGLSIDAKVPAVLAPHGHWNNARFYDEQPETIRQLLATGAERFENAARNHIQARCVQLARMGCIVFHWDMLGYCDSQQINAERAHRFASQPAESEASDLGWLLFSPRAEAHCQSVLGLQTLAVRRAVDMLLTLPQVDAGRVAIAGASGGGTQSFLGAALDERISVAFPAVMVSTGMQGGCTCENACLLRTGTGNVEIAALVAPRPLGMTAADDWTRTMPQDGFPELKKLYGLFGASDKVALFPAIHFGHNFNHVSRVALYGWINDHFKLGFEKPILERDFEIALQEDLTVWDTSHPRPSGGEDFERHLLKSWASNIDKQLQAQLHGDVAQLEQLSQTLVNGWQVCLGLTTVDLLPPRVERNETGANFSAAHVPNWQLSSLPPATLQLATPQADSPPSEVSQFRIEVSGGDEEPTFYYVQFEPAAQTGSPPASDLQALVPNPRLAAAYTYGYNLPRFAQRAQQIGLSIVWLSETYPDRQLTLHGRASGAALAAGGAFVASHVEPKNKSLSTRWSTSKIRLKLEPQSFSFAQVASIRDANFLPGSARFWDLPGLLACTNTQAEIKSPEPTKYTRVQLLAEAAGGSLEASATQATSQD